MNPTTKPTGYVYFVQAVKTGKIKIGYSSDPESRFKGLQTGSSARLKLLSVWPSDRVGEYRLHQYFARFRCGGEWFQMPHPEESIILSVIQDESVNPRIRNPNPKSRELTIFDAPNVCREILAVANKLKEHPDSAVAKSGNTIAGLSQQMLEAILSATDQLLEKVA